MRLIGLLPFLLIGIAVGILATQLFKRSPITAIPNSILGVIGALTGLFLRDVVDAPAGVLPGIIAAVVASCVVVFAINAIGPVIVARSERKGSE